MTDFYCLNLTAYAPSFNPLRGNPTKTNHRTELKIPKEIHCRTPRKQCWNTNYAFHPNRNTQDDGKIWGSHASTKITMSCHVTSCSLVPIYHSRRVAKAYSACPVKCWHLCTKLHHITSEAICESTAGNAACTCGIKKHAHNFKQKWWWQCSS